LFWAALVFGGGIVAGMHAWRPPLWWAVAACALTAAAAFWRARRPNCAVLVALEAIASLGAFDAQVSAVASCDTSILGFADGREVWLTAHLLRDGSVRERPRDSVEVLDLAAEDVSAADVPRPG
jgi:hypothetical protein